MRQRGLIPKDVIPQLKETGSEEEAGAILG